MKTLLSTAALCLSLASLVQARARSGGHGGRGGEGEEVCVSLSFPNTYGIDTCFDAVDRNLCGKEVSEVTNLFKCAVEKVLAFGFNGYQFINVYPLLVEVLLQGRQNLTALNDLASFCVNGSHPDDSFCQVSPTIKDQTCGTPIEFQASVSRTNGSQCQMSCDRVPPTEPTFSLLLVSEFTCIVNLQPYAKRSEILKDVACYLVQLVDAIDLTGFTVKDQIEMLKEQVKTAASCP